MYTNIYKTYKIHTKYQAAAARPGPEAPGPDRDPRLGAAAWYFVYILYILYIFVYICIYFNIF